MELVSDVIAELQRTDGEGLGSGHGRGRRSRGEAGQREGESSDGKQRYAANHDRRKPAPIRIATGNTETTARDGKELDRLCHALQSLAPARCKSHVDARLRHAANG